MLVADALRTVAKWLKEDTGKLPKEEIATLCHALVMARQALGIKE